MGLNSPKERPERSPADVQELLKSAEGLVERVVAQLRREGFVGHSVDDLLGYGRQGLLEAALRFEPDQGLPFPRYAYYRVRGAVLDGLRKMGGWSRRGYERVSLMRAANEASADVSADSPAASELSGKEAAERLRKHMASVVTAMTTGVFCDHVPGEGAIIAVDRGQSAEEQLAQHQLGRLVREAMESLPPPEDVVVRRFYVDGDNMDSIAAELGRSRSWVSRVHTRALSRMNSKLRGKVS